MNTYSHIRLDASNTNAFRVRGNVAYVAAFVVGANNIEVI